MNQHIMVFAERKDITQDRNNFIRFFLILSFVLICVWMVGYLIQLFNLIVFGHSGFYNLVWFGLSVMIYALSYFSLYSPDIFSKKVFLKHNTNGLTDEEIQSIKQKVNTILKIDKPYLNTDLKMPDLAKLVPTSTNTLSKVINEYYGANFYDLINRYRVEEFIRKAELEVHEKTLFAIAHESGFKSKTTFYASFKKFKHCTPSQYFKLNLKQG